MRMMLKVRFPAAAGTAAIEAGALPEAFRSLIDRVKPEAAYFGPSGGDRSALFVFDVQDPAMMPAIAEPFFRLGASIEVTPVMTFAELEAGLAKVLGKGRPAGTAGSEVARAQPR